MNAVNVTDLNRLISTRGDICGVIREPISLTQRGTNGVYMMFVYKHR